MHPEAHLHRPPHRPRHHPYRAASAGSSNHAAPGAGAGAGVGAADGSGAAPSTSSSPSARWNPPSSSRRHAHPPSSSQAPSVAGLATSTSSPSTSATLTMNLDVSSPTSPPMSRILRPISVSSASVTTASTLPRIISAGPPSLPPMVKATTTTTTMTTATAAATPTVAATVTPPRSPHAYHPRATIMITGMRGSGKTTLGLMAATAFSRKFIDLDSALEASVGQSIPSFVARHGWAAFRSREAATLQSVLARHPYDAVIACGGGIVEGTESRELLRNNRDRCPVIVVLRERAAVERFLIEESQNADVAAGIWDVMSRREPHFMECASHIFAVLSAERPEIPAAPDSTPTAGKRSAGKAKAATPPSPEPVHPLSLKKMERSFLRLIRFVLSDPKDGGSTPVPSRPSSPADRTSISALLSGAPQPATTTSSNVDSSPPRYASYPPPTFDGLPGAADATSRSSLLTRRTTFLTVTHPDLRHARSEDFAQLIEGVDALALRIDLMDCMRPASAAVRKRQIASGDPAAKAAPQVDYHEVAFQLERARQFAGDVPLLFIVRSDREGGEFYDDRDLRARNTASPFSQAVYYRLAEVALQMGVELLDIELGWDPAMIKALIAKRGRTRIIATYHDLQGHLRWDTAVAQQLYDRARSFEGIDVVEMIGRSSATEPEQNFHLLCFQAQVMATAAADVTRSLPPLISVNSGEAGRATRPFNACLSPVSHDLQSRKAAPGQMTMREIIRCQADLGFIVKRHFSVLLDEREPFQRATLTTIDAGFETMGLPRQFHTMKREWIWELAKVRNGRLPNWLSPTHRRAAIVGSSFPREQRALFDAFFALPPANTSIVDGGDESQEVGGDKDGKAYGNGIGSGIGHVTGNGSTSSTTTSTPSTTDPNAFGPPLTLAAVAVRAIDVCAVADVSQRKLGTPEGRMIPHGFCSLPGPMVGDHTLPKALQRLVSENLSPINAPGPSSSALVIVLPPPNDAGGGQGGGGSGMDESDEVKDRTSSSPSTTSSIRDTLRLKAEIETRAAIFALGKLSFGRCAVVDLWADAEGGGEEGDGGGGVEAAHTTTTTTTTTTTASRTTSSTTPWFGAEVADVVRARPNPLGLHSADPPKFEAQRLPASALWDMPTALSAWRNSNSNSSRGPGTPKMESGREVSSSKKVRGTDSPSTSSSPSLLAAALPTTTPVSRPLVARSPAAVVIVGGSEGDQLRALASLRREGMGKADETGTGAPGTTERGATTRNGPGNGLEASTSTPTATSMSTSTSMPVPASAPTRWTPGSALPESLWDTHMGGTVIRLPTSHSSSSPSSDLPTHPSADLRTLLEPRLERYGWIHVGPEMVEFEQTTRGAFEPFTRRRPPRPDMAEAWKVARMGMQGAGGGGERGRGTRLKREREEEDVEG